MLEAHVHNSSSRQWPPDVCTMHTGLVLPQQAKLNPTGNNCVHDTPCGRSSKLRKSRKPRNFSSFKSLSALGSSREMGGRGSA
ncbi:hypothetical protein V6N13_136042 [Hibiscus sabdariffa]|uniref:Uncharacterized protein n=1 Tax=Hibiscus sabdariffa TaxID=183260 RepID=A0ABR2DPR7_9ROSI